MRGLQLQISKSLLSKILVQLIIVAVLFELSLQLIYLLDAKFLISLITKPGTSVENHWKDNFIKNHELNFTTKKYFPLPNKANMPHPTRGWTPKINYRGFYNTNNKGQRGIEPYSYSDSKFRIVTIGDSFTFGTGISDNFTWPELLSKHDSDYQVINLGVGGYGIDQMYIRLMEEIAEYKPHLVVLAFIDDDLNRSMLKFYGYKKPRFVVIENKLINTQGRIEGAEQVYKELKSEDALNSQKYNGFFSFYAFSNLSDIITDQLNFDESKETTISLNTRLFKEIEEVCFKNQSELLIVHLANGQAMRTDKVISSGEIFLKNYSLQSKSHALYTRWKYLELKRNWVNFHYGRTENQILSNLINDRIRQIDTWNKWLTKSKEAENK